MCGIRLVVTRQQQHLSSPPSAAATENESSSNAATAAAEIAATTQKPMIVPDWLQRRGPDSMQQQQQVVVRQDDEELMMTSRQQQQHTHHHNSTVLVVATLQASVLQMRQELVPQPVEIHHVVTHRPTTTSTTTTAASTTRTLRTTTTTTDTKEEEPRRRIYHFAWNGEIYQRQQSFGSSSHPGGEEEEKDDNDLEDTWSYEMSDTRLVAEMIQKECHDSFDEDDDLLERITKRVFSRLVNAEYSFCLLTDTAVYYGRDGLGRRSLLLWQQQQHEQQQQQPTTRSRATEVLWELASVATNNHNTTMAEDRDGSDWIEVEPGHVYCYKWVDGSTRSCSLTQASAASAVPLLQKPFSTPPSSIQKASEQLRHLLFQAVQRRVIVGNAESPCAVLFSGGVDSVVLAALVCEALPPDASIELINVSFVDQHEQQQQQQQQQQQIDQQTTTTLAADTLAALASFHELKRLYPHHVNLRLVQQQADWIEIAAVESRIRNLVYPKETLMDVNIATALWFAAKACTGKLLLSGLGADEQMGGYGRHRKAWEWNTLREELDLDIQRLWDRNLGRDDRVLSDHGQETRFPYLDVNVMDYLARLPLELVCDFSLPPGQGDKRILRLVAEQLGLKIASVAVKRAIQFGSRISHVSDKRRFGSRRKASGTKPL